MRAIREWIHRLVGTLRPGRRDDDLAEELRLHQELAAEAGRPARVKAGGGLQAMDALRDQRGLPWLEDLVRDVRHGLRSLRRSPVFTAVALATLALGIGANTAIFSILNGVILRPLGYPDPGRLMYLSTQLAAYSDLQLSPPEYFEFRELSRSFADTGAFVVGEANLAAGDRPLRVRSAWVDEQLFATLRLRPSQGRGFAQGETVARGGAPPPAIAILSTSCGRRCLEETQSWGAPSKSMAGLTRSSASCRPART